jgi:hypothetical protein
LDTNATALDAGVQLILSSTWVHVYAIYALSAIIAFNFYTVHTEKRFFFLATRLKKVTPLFHSVNFIVAYTGAVLSGFTHDLSPTVVLMIPISILLMILEIKRYKKMRVIKLAQSEKQEEFKDFAKKIYTTQVIAIVSMYMIAVLY